MATKTEKTAAEAAVAAAAGDVNKPDELTAENTVDGDDGQYIAAGSGNAGVDLTGSETNVATGLTGAEMVRKAVFSRDPIIVIHAVIRPVLMLSTQKNWLNAILRYGQKMRKRR